MPLIPAKCTECGSILHVDNSDDVTVCSHCGTSFIAEKAVNNDSISIKMNDSAVNAGELSLEQLLANAEIFRKFGEPENALDCYDTVCSRFPSEWRSWWGKFSVETDDGKKITELTEKLTGGLAAERAIAAGAPDSVKNIYEKYKYDTSEWTMAVHKIREEKKVLSKAQASELNKKKTELTINRNNISDSLEKYTNFKMSDSIFKAAMVLLSSGFLLVVKGMLDEYISFSVIAAGFILAFLTAFGTIGMGLFRKRRSDRLYQEEKSLDEAVHNISEQLSAVITEKQLHLKDVLEYPQARKVYSLLTSEGKTPSLRRD